MVRLFHAVLSTLVNVNVAITVILSGLVKIAESQGLASKTELFERYNVTICDIAAKRILEQPDAIVSFLEVLNYTDHV